MQKHHVCERNCTWDPSTCICENGKYLGIIIGDSEIICDELREVAKSIPTKTVLKKTNPINFNKKKRNLYNRKILYFTRFFINYHITIVNCSCLPLILKSSL